MPVDPTAKMAVLQLRAELATPCRESFPTVKSNLIVSFGALFAVMLKPERPDRAGRLQRRPIIPKND